MSTTPGRRAEIDQVTAHLRDTIDSMATDCLKDHAEACKCDSALCPGPIVMSFFSQPGLSQIELIMFASAAIRMLADERARNK